MGELSEQQEVSIGKYGRMRQQYLKEHCPDYYNSLIESEKLYPHLLEIEQAAQNLLDIMMPPLMEEAGATDELKVCDPIHWVGVMYMKKAQVEEKIQEELIYKSF